MKPRTHWSIPIILTALLALAAWAGTDRLQLGERLIKAETTNDILIERLARMEAKLDIVLERLGKR